MESRGRRLSWDSTEEAFFRSCNVNFRRLLVPWSLVEDVFRETPRNKFFSFVVMSSPEENFVRRILHHSTTKNKQSTTQKQLRTLVDKYHTKAEHKHNQYRQKSHSTSTRTEKMHQNRENAHQNRGNAGERKQKARIKKKQIFIKGKPLSVTHWLQHFNYEKPLN